MTDEALRERPRVALHFATAIPPHNLPESLTNFVGRSRELKRLAGLIDEHRLVTLLGTGGVGKSRLAIELARTELAELPDGAWLVDLSGVGDPRLVVHSVAAVVGVAQGPTRALSTALCEILKPRRLLLILDNCEHLIESCADVSVLLTSRCPDLRILATSREPIGIDGEQILRIEPLPTLPAGTLNPRQLRATDAARLFAERARGARADFELSDTIMEPVAEICRRLDGLPLALELAAARLRTMTVHELAAGLDQRFQLLTTGSRTAHPRHRTLMGMVEWSTMMLEVSESTLLRRLAVFVGGWTREAAVAVCQDSVLPESDISPALDTLVDRSLVVLDDWHGSSRYRLLDTMRVFALGRLADAGEEAELRRRHQEHFLAMLERSVDDVASDQLAWLARMDAELDNIRAALDWCAADPLTVERALYAMWGLWVYCEVRGLAPELVHRYDELLSLARSGPYSAGQLLAETLLCHTLGQLGEMERAAQLLGQAAARAPSVEDPWARSFCSLIQLQLKMVLGDPSAVALARQELERETRQPHRYGRGVWLWFLGETLLMFGDMDDARAAFTEALETLPLQRERALIMRGLAILAFRCGDFGESERLFHECLAVLAPFGDIRNLALTLEELACVAAFRNQCTRAARLLGASEMLFDLVSTLPPPWWQLGPQDAHRRCCEILGDARYVAELAAGRSMSVDRALAYGLDMDADASSAPTPDGPLSRRELEVARLVAQGLSNRRIAEVLVISQKTVESHVAHALTKLGLHSRASLAVWVTQRDP
jgi:non-specific serine/threonine protein kinase